MKRIYTIGFTKKSLEEFIKLLKKFPEWLNCKLQEYTRWFNHKRYHRGIQTTPATLFT